MKSEFSMSHLFDAPRDEVWKAWTQPELMAQWWGPKGFKAVSKEMDFRPGGIYHYGLTAPGGITMWGKFTYQEIIKPERILLVNSFADENANIVRHPFVATWPMEMSTTFLFAEKDGKTEITVKWSPIDPTDIEQLTFDGGMESMKMGWTGTFSQFEEFLAKA